MNANVLLLPPSKMSRSNAVKQAVCDPSSINALKSEFNNRPKVDNTIVTIYSLVHLPTGERVYTGRTKDPDRRLAQHALRQLRELGLLSLAASVCCSLLPGHGWCGVRERGLSDGPRAAWSARVADGKGRYYADMARRA